MPLDRFELLELRRDDGIQTYHAREVATHRPVQVHLFHDSRSRDALDLLSRVAHLPDAERRRVLDRGISGGRPYVVTDRLAGFASLREWLDQKCPPSADDQFARLFDDEPSAQPVESRDIAESTSPDPEPAPEPAGESRIPIVAFALGAAAALLFLALLLAYAVLRPHRI